MSAARSASSDNGHTRAEDTEEADARSMLFEQEEQTFAGNDDYYYHLNGGENTAASSSSIVAIHHQQTQRSQCGDIHHPLRKRIIDPVQQQQQQQHLGDDGDDARSDVTEYDNDRLMTHEASHAHQHEVPATPSILFLEGTRLHQDGLALVDPDGEATTIMTASRETERARQWTLAFDEQMPQLEPWTFHGSMDDVMYELPIFNDSSVGSEEDGHGSSSMLSAASFDGQQDNDGDEITESGRDWFDTDVIDAAGSGHLQHVLELIKLVCLWLWGFINIVHHRLSFQAM